MSSGSFLASSAHGSEIMMSICRSSPPWNSGERSSLRCVCASISKASRPRFSDGIRNTIRCRRCPLLAVVATLTLGVPVRAQQRPLYLDESLTFEQRARDLVSRMTLEEKVMQMKDVAPAIPRLGVPEYNWWNEALHGVARAGLATVFPQAIAVASTWDDSAMFQMATVISDEARAKHHEYLRRESHQRYQGLTFWSPNINLFRDPRWGRG